MAQNKFTVFWSWQSDSDTAINRNFIQDCLERAAKNVGKGDGVIIAVDRDTKGVGGTPNIADTILAKIRASDIFVWDATLAYSKPRAAPNPNVMLEFGYALAILGDGRMIGVLNDAAGAPAEELPFDLKHRRWPLSYHLAKKRWTTRRKQYLATRDAVRKQLVSNLEGALRQALQEPKRGALRSDPDLHAARSLWKRLDSSWMRDWWEKRGNYPQYEDKSTVLRFNEYIRVVEQPEFRFTDAVLADRHGRFVRALHECLRVGALEMIPDQNPDVYVSTVKDASNRGRHLKDFDKKYDQQNEKLTAVVDGVWSAWEAYVGELKTHYADVVHGVSGEPPPSPFEERGNSTKHELALAVSSAVHELGDTLSRTVDSWRMWGNVPNNNPHVLEGMRAAIFPPLEALPISRVKAVFGEDAAAPLNLLKNIAQTVALGLDIERGLAAGLKDGAEALPNIRARAGYYDLPTSRQRFKDLVNLVSEWAGGYLGSADIQPVDAKTLAARAIKIYEDAEAKLKRTANET